MAVGYRSVSSAGTATATLTLAAPAGVTAGDVMLAAIATDGATITTLAGWTLVRTNGTTNRLAIYSRVAAALETGPYAWVLSTTGASRGTVAAFTGIHNTTPVDTSGGGAANGGTKTAPSLTASTNDEMLVTFYDDDQNSTFTTPAGMTEIADGSQGGNIALAVDYLAIVATGATGTKASTASGAGNGQVGSVLLNGLILASTGHGLGLLGVGK